MSSMILKVWKSSNNVIEENLVKPKQEGLPYQICGRILDLQFETQKQSLRKEIVIELLDLYTQAVEFYEERQNLKYKSYQKRMQKFLKRPDIQLIMKGQQNQFQVYKKKQHHLAEIQKADKVSKIVASRIIEGTEVKAQKQKSIIQQTLEYQQTQLQDRIQRKRAISGRSTHSNRHIEDQQQKQQMNVKLLLRGIQTRNNKRVFI